MITSHSHKFIFIHVYKVAGSSMESVLNKYEPRYVYFIKKIYRKLGWNISDHITAMELRNKINVNIFNNYFKFAFVRNPFDWQVSLFCFARKNKKHHQHEMINKMTFDEYIDWRVNNEIHLQKNFVCSENGEVLVDFIGRYENIQNDFEKICKTIGIEKIKLPHTNISNHKPFMDYYNEKTKKMVYDAFGEDFKMFNYE
ncbi:hypothetical protein A2331_06105 [Candidatus Falkowbacteria bacterium RIFOXYB2_FULL_34_18]|uniref:Uncharacterized protein n=1 Tax=Candidatus Falkowbacteria bacterium RIFOXYD2_FULL_34_120 TaxID=1798007 RepID=A0A1F5TPW8_9BACT|nr:MAG: hypothetical protein A2331_06105 [Candidatus Falkowbacteria bacterium RIFOXYB2_FULL_34_18]OGF28985.1 MAG: hypothetical protein A2500_01820 [Candidatus Falkowbacteria bacterium RIFOXYC12_FULL_34_55]OGF35895.1 MAG: hypothetical protein A2466_02320 [Candidatus Falkowbacteria bacterium RIFOXYC2_FULL_34_220]OGF38492.1 MAG: hypothetical protein A2515_03105 [Candidatus Falkowbacteria bacterium RIFOXYD12_FULL_34_57]OGF40571.1 MAG: hypothetical protein A2531_03510 [Candidatus Falkowbacteria bact